MDLHLAGRIAGAKVMDLTLGGLQAQASLGDARAGVQKIALGQFS